MVTAITDTLPGALTHRHRGLIVEIVGPAGAGKTTLFRALEKHVEGVRTEFLPPVWNYRYSPFFIKHIILLIPTLVRLREKGDRNLTRRELAWMAMLRGWPKILRTNAEGDNRTILLDQGPIFLMAILSEFGPKGLRNQSIHGYWEKITEEWAHTLDMIVWLDTSDDLLVKRIRTRWDEHLMKEKTDREIRDFLARYRFVYERLIKKITANNPQIRVFQLDTGERSVEYLVQNFFDFTH